MSTTSSSVTQMDEKATPPRPNVFLARNRAPVTVDGVINAGRYTIDVPSEEEQRRGFYTPHASVLISQFPGTYKMALLMGREPRPVQVRTPPQVIEPEGQSAIDTVEGGGPDGNTQE
jgi:hypothetical protein